MIARIRAFAARLRREHLERNYRTVAPHVAAGARVLDIGAGDNTLAAALRDRLGAQVVGVDVADRNRGDAELRLMRGASLPVGDGERFDVVMLLYVLHHARDDAALLREATRVLAPGGTLLIAEDRVETFAERVRTIAFHVWLLLCTGMGWRGRFRRIAAWRARFAAHGLRVRDVIELGAEGRLFPRNLLFVLGR